VGAGDPQAPACGEATLKYHPGGACVLTWPGEAPAGTAAGGEFDWGGRLPKSNGGAQWFPQPGWPSGVERKGTRELDCETYKSSRCESRA
jgi:hypothetical protein